MGKLRWYQSLNTKIIAIAIGGVAATVTSILTVVAVKRQTMKEEVNEEIMVLAKGQAEAVAKDAYRLCEVANEELQSKVEGALKVLQDQAGRGGGMRLDAETVRWTAVDQLSKAERSVELPRVLVGDRWLGQERSARKRVPLVDPSRDLAGGTFTVFQRMNERGDMLRVATNVIGRDGNRAIGTFIPASRPDGSPDPVVSAVLGGQTFRGRAFVVDAWYLTAYAPLQDGEGKVIGMLYAGIPRDRIASLRRGLLSMKLGKSGYVYAIGGTGNERGRYVLSQGGKRDGENIWDAKDSDGNYFIRAVVEKGMAAPRGEVDFVRYPWLNRAAGELTARYKLAAVTYFEPWDWVIGAGAYEDDFADARGRVDSSSGAIVNWAIGVGLVVALLFALGATWFSRRATGNLRKAVDAAHAFAEGRTDRAAELEVRSNDETGQLVEALREMAGGVRRAIEATGQVTAAAAEGRLDVRAELTSLPGDFAQLARGVNSALDAAVGPLKMAADFVEQVARGVIPPQIVTQFRGDFGLRDNLNTLAETLQAFVAEMEAVSKRQDAGELDAALSTDRFRGVYCSMAEGVNAMVSGTLEMIQTSMACDIYLGIPIHCR